MKKLGFILVLATLVLLNSCGKNAAEELEVMTYNLKFDNISDKDNNWDSRKTFLISQVQYYSPDIMGTQEGLEHQLEDIKVGLSVYDYIGISRGGDSGGEYSAIFYNMQKYEVLEQNTFWLSETPNESSIGWDAAYRRICTYGHFKSKETGREFFVFNTHFDHVGNKAREQSSKLILSKIKELNPQSLPVVLIGDFNLEASRSELAPIAQQMDDTYSVAPVVFGPKGTFNGFFFDRPVVTRIDYVFVSKQSFNVLKNGTFGDSYDCKYPSDHLPVMATMEFLK